MRHLLGDEEKWGDFDGRNIKLYQLDSHCLEYTTDALRGQFLPPAGYLVTSEDFWLSQFGWEMLIRIQWVEQGCY